MTRWSHSLLVAGLVIQACSCASSDHPPSAPPEGPKDASALVDATDRPSDVDASSPAVRACGKDLGALASRYRADCLAERCCDAAGACAASSACLEYDACTGKCFAGSPTPKEISACVSACKAAQGGVVPPEFEGFSNCKAKHPTGCAS